MRIPAVALPAVVCMTLLVAACSGSAESTPRPGASEPAALETIAAVAVASDTPTSGREITRQPSGGLTGTTTVGNQDDPRPAPLLVGLRNPDGTDFDLTTLRGDPALLFFGYTHCPDVCPATIGELFGVFEAQPDVKVVFVSVDPERDTVEFLQEWTQYFPENFNAVTGTPGAIRRAADEYGIKYARVETSSATGYAMSHTADVFLIDPAGQLLRSYPFGTPAAAMVADISQLMTG